MAEFITTGLYDGSPTHACKAIEYKHAMQGRVGPCKTTLVTTVVRELEKRRAGRMPAREPQPTYADARVACEHVNEQSPLKEWRAAFTILLRSKYDADDEELAGLRVCDIMRGNFGLSLSLNPDKSAPRAFTVELPCAERSHFCPAHFTKTYIRHLGYGKISRMSKALLVPKLRATRRGVLPIHHKPVGRAARRNQERLLLRDAWAARRTRGDTAMEFSDDDSFDMPDPDFPTAEVTLDSDDIPTEDTEDSTTEEEVDFVDNPFSPETDSGSSESDSSGAEAVDLNEPVLIFDL